MQSTETEGTKTESSKPVIAITDLGAIRFNSLQECLDSHLVEYQDTIFTNGRHFRQACTIKRLHKLCEQLTIEKPDNIDDGRSDAAEKIWLTIENIAQTPAEANEKLKQSPRPERPERVPGDRKGPGRGKKLKYGDDWIITVLADKNPKRGHAAIRFNLYQSGMTVREYLAAGGLRQDVNWDSHPKNGWIKVDPPAGAPVEPAAE